MNVLVATALSSRVFCMERWIGVVNYRGYYEVSDLGNVRACRREYFSWERFKGGKYGWHGRIVKARNMRKTDHQGYLRVTLTKDGISKSFLLHRLVYMSFNKIPLEFQGQKSNALVLHKNDIQPDCRLENLFIGSQYDNVQDCIKKGRGNLGRKIPTNKRSGKITYEIASQIRDERIRTGRSIYKLADLHGVSYATISRIINNKIWV